MMASIPSNTSGLDIYSAITTFNLVFYGGSDVDDPSSPTSNVRYKPSKQIIPYKSVLETMANTNMYETFGMSYSDIMKLSWDEWKHMCDIMHAKIIARQEAPDNDE